MDPLARIALDLAGAAVAGAAIGWERSYFGRAAGLRTHVLLTLGAATIMSVATWPEVMIARFPPHTFQMDPARLIQGVMAGIGFLGGGVVVKEGVSLYGLTSAASIWITTAIGIVFGLGYPEIGAAVTIATLGTLVGLRRVELFFPRQVYALAIFTFEARNAPGQTELIGWLKERGARLDHLSMRYDRDQDRRTFRGTIQVRHENAFMALDNALVQREGLIHYEMARNNK